MVMTQRQSLFFAATNKKLASQISIKSPQAFRKSINTVKKGGVTLEEKRALVLAQNRAGAQLKRSSLSMKERLEFTLIRGMKLPKITKK